MVSGVAGALTIQIGYADVIERERDWAVVQPIVGGYLLLVAGCVEERIPATSAAPCDRGMITSRKFLEDHLGSAISVKEADDLALQRFRFDARGGRRNADQLDDAELDL